MFRLRAYPVFLMVSVIIPGSEPTTEALKGLLRPCGTSPWRGSQCDNGFAGRWTWISISTQTELQSQSHIYGVALGKSGCLYLLEFPPLYNGNNAGMAASGIVRDDVFHV